MGDDLMVFSWNLENKSDSALTSDTDTLPRIVSGVIDTISKGDGGLETPFVGFLLEIKGGKGGVRRMCKRIEQEYHRQTSRTIKVTSSQTDGAPSTAESIIVVSQGVKVEPTRFDVQEGLKAFTELDRTRSFGKLSEHESAMKRFNLRNNRDKHTLGASPKAWHYRKIDREPEWYRNGVIADVRHGEKTIRVASIHAPGPDFSRIDGVTDSIIQSAVGHNVDVLIGDLNRRGSLQSDRFNDLSQAWTTGTTFARDTPGALGESRWDRVLAKPNPTFSIESPNPVAIFRDPGLGLKRLTDHALVYARIRNPAPGFKFDLTDAAGPGGADLRSLEASRALIQPADPTLLYGAASDRKNPSDEQLQKQLKQQLDENPLTSNSSEPASDPLSPPSASSPLTEPPASSAMDEGIGAESAEAMDAMAAEGEEVADMVVALL